MLRKGIAFLVACVSAFLVQGQVTLTGSSYAQNFNSLANTGTSGSLPDAGWFLSETGTSANANGLYTAGTGSGNTGDSYSFGTSGSSERALGSLTSGTCAVKFGFGLTNGTGTAISSISVRYKGEQWRLGAVGRADRLLVEYSLDATSLNTGTWVPVPSLDFIAPITAGTVGLLDGNVSANQTVVQALIGGLNISVGASFFIRWTDQDAASADDGIAIDDFLLNIPPGSPSALSYYRTALSGSWSDPASWESSSDNVTWGASADAPTSASYAISIRNGHTITLDATTSADELTVETGGTLVHTLGVAFTLPDGAGTDMLIRGIYVLNGTIPTLTGSIEIASGGLVRVDANGGTADGDDFAFSNANIIFKTGSVFEWNVTLTPTSSTTTYFYPGEIPIFRISKNVSSFGAGSVTTINGVLENNASLSLQGAGNKVVVNGIIGSGDITPGAFTGNIVFNGTTAQLGGSGTITLPASPATLQIGTGTTCTMTSAKTINGDVQILANSYIDAGAYDLMISGNIAGGTTNYVRTASTGSLILKNVTTGRTFPVGHSGYNPLIIDNGSGHDWTVRVNDGVVADPPNGITGAVLVTWNISPSVNPPAAGADITFQFDNATQTGTQFNTAPYNTPDNVQAWHRKNGYWLGAGVPMPLTNAGGNTRTLKVFGLTQFSPYALSRVMLPLPVELLSFNALRKANGGIGCDWVTAQACRPGVLFLLEGSMDGILFRELDRMPASVVGTIHVRTLSDGNERFRFVRLRIVEPDGRVQTGRVVELKPMEREMGIERIWLSGGVLRAAVYSPSSSAARWVVVDMLGRVLSAGNTQIITGVHLMNFPTSLPHGIHQLVIYSGQKSSSRAFLNPKP